MPTKRGVRVNLPIEAVEAVAIADFLSTLNPDPTRVGTPDLVMAAAILRDPPDELAGKLPAALRARYEAEVRRRGRWGDLERYEAACDEAGGAMFDAFVENDGALPITDVFERVDRIPTPGVDA